METSPEIDLGVLRARAVSVLKTVIDPELLVNIFDLGLVYDILIFTELIQVKMTLSTPNCPMGRAIISKADQLMAAEFTDRETIITLVWEPAWKPDMITEQGRRELYADS